MLQLAKSVAPEIVWSPLPGSQELAIDARCNEIALAGDRGGGKTDVQLMCFRRHVGQGYGRFWRGILFDREYKNLDDVVTKSLRWFNAFNDGAQWLSSNSQYKWVWPTGEELLLRSIKDKQDYDNYHGQEFPFIAWNELTKHPTSTLYDMMMSCNRSSFTVDKDAAGRTDLPPIPLKVISTFNPYGKGHAWVKERFIDAAPYGQVIRKSTNIYNPRTKAMDDVIRTQVTLFLSWRENPYLSPEYIASLYNETDVNRRKAWLDCNWDIVAGGAFDDVWVKPALVIPRFVVPERWHLDRSFDWGSTAPFSIGWWAEANGEEAILPDGTIFCPQSGSLIQFSEWYGAQKRTRNTGLKMSPGDIARRMVEHETELLRYGWIKGPIWAGPADNQIRQTTQIDVDTIEKKMADNGINWTTSDKSAGSRHNGLELVRERMRNSVLGEGQGIYFMDNCRASIATIPVLPRDEDDMDDVDTESEDHPYDMTRYRVLAGGSRAATSIPTKWVC